MCNINSLMTSHRNRILYKEYSVKILEDTMNHNITYNFTYDF